MGWLYSGSGKGGCVLYEMWVLQIYNLYYILHAFWNLTQERLANNSEIQWYICFIKSTLFKAYTSADSSTDLSSDVGCVLYLGSWHIEINETESSTDFRSLSRTYAGGLSLWARKLTQSSVYSSYSCSTYKVDFWVCWPLVTQTIVFTLRIGVLSKLQDA